MRSRLFFALALVAVLSTSAIAFAAGADTNDAFVDGQIKPSKLDKKKYKPVELLSGVRTSVQGGVNGTQSNPASEYLSYSKNIKFDLNQGSVCTTLPPNGSTAQQARDACPKDSYIGAGEAEVQGPGLVIDDVIVSAFRGPAKNGIQLHTESQGLGQAAPTVLAEIVKSRAGKGFGQALSVPNAPATGGIMITKFNATIFKSSKVVTARCKSKNMTFQRLVTYKDGTSETAEITQKCKRKSVNAKCAKARTKLDRAKSKLKKLRSQDADRNRVQKAKAQVKKAKKKVSRAC